MSFARDRLYNGYLRNNMSAIVSTVKVREIIVHLPCLTDHDRETIEAKRETCGNYDAMRLLLDCLKRRENWPEQFIQALEECEHPTIAADIRAEYNALRGINNSASNSPSTTVVSAHVHPSPSAGHVPFPENGGNSQAAAALPAQVSAPPEPAAWTAAPLEAAPQPYATQSTTDQVPKAVSPSKHVPESPRSTQTEVAPPPTPPPSPETPHTPASTPPQPQREVPPHEPEENSELEIQGATAATGVSPDQVSAGNSEMVSVSSVLTPPPARSVEQETDPQPSPESLQTTTTTEDPYQTQTNSEVSSGSSFLTLTPEKPPVQDTTPPVDRVHRGTTLEPEETSEPPATQVVKGPQHAETAAAASPMPGAAVVEASLSVCLSKPGELISVQQNLGNPTISAHSFPEEPYSGNSGRLEFSEAAPDTVTSAHVPAPCAVSSTPGNIVPVPPYQKNGIAVNRNEPEENHYESPGQSLEMQEVRENVVQVSEEPSILNLDAQRSAPQNPVVNSEAAKDITSVPPSSTTTANTISSLKTQSSENWTHPPEAAPADVSPGLKTLPDSEKVASHTLTTYTKYILPAAGVITFALLMAWRFRK
ncbi:mitochondrial antiviral-signaling protein isoform X2 [Mastacembelus armatus]|nr:mucin-2-like isoform X2 [Mastacembelus armatus]